MLGHFRLRAGLFFKISESKFNEIQSQSHVQSDLIFSGDIQRKNIHAICKIKNVV